jgi:hypothetical protein
MCEKQNIKKSQIAIIQLRKAIQLFNSDDFISSLTLAGAANEIFGQLALRRQGYNTLDGDKWFWDGISEMYGKDKPSKEKIKQVNNRIKNSLKHHDKTEDDFVMADFEFEAQCQIDWAIRNYWIAFNKPLRDRIVDRYVRMNWL